MGRRQMLELVRDIGKRRVSVMLSTHLLHDVEQVCDSVVVLDKGKLALEGRLDATAATSGPCGTRLRDPDPRRHAGSISRSALEPRRRHRRGQSRATEDYAVGKRLRGSSFDEILVRGSPLPPAPRSGTCDGSRLAWKRHFSPRSMSTRSTCPDASPRSFLSAFRTGRARRASTEASPWDARRRRFS